MKIKTLLFSSLALLLSGAMPAFSEVEEADKVNRAALSLLRQGKKEESIALWERIPPAKRGAEIRNNLGYAYYLRSMQYFDIRHGEETFFNLHYKEAKSNLLASQKMAPNRWSVHLNLGDLFFSYKQLPEAAAQYKNLLTLNPNYRHAEKIKARIRSIERESVYAKKRGFTPLVAEVHPSLPLRAFRLNSGTYEDFAIEVLIGDDSKVAQSLKCEMLDGRAMYAVDLNFDGYLDLLALSYMGTRYNYGYCNWLYDSDTGAYKAGVAGEDEAELTAPYVDYLNKTIMTTWSGSDLITSFVYRYEHDKLVTEKKITLERLGEMGGEGNGYRRTVKKRVKGEMITESSKVLPLEEALSHLRH